MNYYLIGDKVKCVSSDGMDQLMVGRMYTVDYVYNDKEISVEEVCGVVHWTKRFELAQEQTK